MGTPQSAADDLRAWASGWLSLEAAVEVLIRSVDGRFTQPSNPWILQDRPDRPFWLDAAAIGPNSGSLSDGERRVLAVVEALALGSPLWDLGGILAGLDRQHLALILAAVAHAGGSHEQVEVAVTDTGISWEPIGSLFPWPAQTVKTER